MTTQDFAEDENHHLRLEDMLFGAREASKHFIEVAGDNLGKFAFGVINFTAINDGHIDNICYDVGKTIGLVGSFSAISAFAIYSVIYR